MGLPKVNLLYNSLNWLVKQARCAAREGIRAIEIEVTLIEIGVLFKIITINSILPGDSLICSPKLDGLSGEMTACSKHRQKRLTECENPCLRFPWNTAGTC